MGADMACPIRGEQNGPRLEFATQPFDFRAADVLRHGHVRYPGLQNPAGKIDDRNEVLMFYTKVPDKFSAWTTWQLSGGKLIIHDSLDRDDDHARGIPTALGASPFDFPVA